MNIAYVKTLPDVRNGLTVWFKSFLTKAMQLGHTVNLIGPNYVIHSNYDYSWGLTHEYPDSELLSAHIVSLRPDIVLVTEELKKLPPSFFDTFEGRIVAYPHDVAFVCPLYGYNPLLGTVCPHNRIGPYCYGCTAYEYKSYTGTDFYYDKNKWWELTVSRLATAHCIVPSQFMAEFYGGTEYFRSMKVVPNGIDVPSKKYVRAPGSKKVLLVCGWSDKSDTLDSVSSCLEPLISKGFTFYSTGYSNEYIHKLEPVSDRKDIEKIYSGFDVYLSLYQFKESYSLALAEANSYGLATVVLANTGATLERNPTKVVYASPGSEDFEAELTQAVVEASCAQTTCFYEGSMLDNASTLFSYLENLA